MQATLDYALGLEEKYDVSPIVQVLKPKSLLLYEKYYFEETIC